LEDEMKKTGLIDIGIEEISTGYGDG